MSNADTVALSWARIVRWLQENAPASAAALNPPATDTDLQYLSGALGSPVPEPLETWLCLNNGSTAKDSITQIPGGQQLDVHQDSSIFPRDMVFLDCQRIISNHRDFLHIAGDIGDEDWWKPTWIPILAHFDSHSGLTMDAGMHGATSPLLSYSESDYPRPHSPSLGEFLADVADALEQTNLDGPLTRRHQASVQDGRLVWK
ncbi:molybdenum cofactor biosysnthesis protein MoeA [Streptomyces sp. NBC_00249]|uniref:molybdenum cofactor biosysnthesis protein MoeA n=1 Tax=Streptomyces sp. NBC_00249 TaxID=2975690 RepID=UPI0022573E7A|nr:molybdenum cofactor biosysnthesis protein MoeA [Streptomyces sp. NBC_00249]MCX5199769.1 molybdenum cofactor biosysnthesis protein MoeA [Streptomyces sp. NBC_00249]